MKTEFLERIGLTRNEGLVYLTLVREGTCKSAQILKSSGLNSGKIYEILESLKKKGLVSESSINKIKNYTAAPPSQILEYLKQKKMNLEKEEAEAKKEILSLEKLRGKKVKEVMAVTYTGINGLRAAADEALKEMGKGDEILSMGVTGKKDKKFKNFWMGWTKKRIGRKIIAKHIFSENGDYFNEFKKLNFTKSRILEGLTPVAIDVFGKRRVLILNYNEPVSCTMICDENTAASFINFFYQLWKIAKD